LVELKEKRLRKSLSEAKNHWQGQKDLNPRHAVLERLLKNQNRIDKPLFKPKFGHQNCVFVILMLF
jgi:hypothetical protein